MSNLFRLVMSAETSTTTTTNPAVNKYFYSLDAASHRVSGTITIPAVNFYDDAGNTMTGNLTTASANNGYYLLTVNGQSQQSSLFTVGASGSSVAITQASTVPDTAPITLTVNNFAPNSTSTTTVTG